MSRRITLLTDFGTRDGYAAVMKGVLASLAPDAAFDDAAHDVAPGDVRGAAWALGRYWRRFPAGTIHLVVVDPGVGTRRRAVAAEADGRLLVAPDNGALTRVFGEARAWRCVEITNERYVAPDASSTFHGRDVFAPAAGHLAAGLALEDLGAPVDDPVRIEEPTPVREGERGARGEIVHVDAFGNLVTNLPGAWLEGVESVRVGGRWIPATSAYANLAEGALLALVNSDGLVEVAVRGGSAADVLGAGRGMGVGIGRSSSTPPPATADRPRTACRHDP